MAYADAIGCKVSVRDHGGRCPDYRLSGFTGKNNILTQSLDSLGLAGTKSATKFIPPAYLTASRHDRLRLLAGLIDSDGAATKSGIDYVTKSRELSADLVYLARSLGFWARATQKYSTCQTGEGGWFYRVSIWGDFSQVPIQLPRRVPAVRRMRKCPRRTGFRVEYAGRGPFFGFTLNDDHRYVDGHFVVHHNSGKTPCLATICRDAVMRWDGRVLVVSHVKELLQQAVDKLRVVCPELPVGVYSASLKRRDTDDRVIVAGIQSVYRRACELDSFDLIICDECHLIPRDGDGMYRQFLPRRRSGWTQAPSVRRTISSMPYVSRSG
jgi:hypothetical protein